MKAKLQFIKFNKFIKFKENLLNKDANIPILFLQTRKRNSVEGARNVLLQTRFWLIVFLFIIINIIVLTKKVSVFFAKRSAAIKIWIAGKCVFCAHFSNSISWSLGRKTNFSVICFVGFFQSWFDFLGYSTHFCSF